MSSPLPFLTTSSPASLASFSATLRDAVRGVLALAKSLTHRREVARMLEMDDRMLRDTGIVRSDVLGALAAPMTRDPSVLLCLRSVDYRVRQRAREADAWPTA